MPRPPSLPARWQAGDVRRVDSRLRDTDRDETRAFATSPPPWGEGHRIAAGPHATAPGEGTAARDTAWPTDRIWYLLYTSGTTGRPKAVIQTVGMALANYVNVQQATGLTAADTTVNFLPLFHTAGINLHTLPLFLAGGTSTVLAKFEVDPLLDLIARGASRCSSACRRSTRR